MSEATKAKLRGRKVSDETRQRICQIMGNRSPEWNRKISEANKGKKLNEKQ